MSDGGQRLVVIGGDAAGMTAASHVRRAVPEVEIVVIERGPYTSYTMCGIPYLVGGEIAEAEDLVIRSPADFEARGITVHTDTEAVGIDAERQVVRVRPTAGGEEREEPYDALLYATGAHPVQPPLPGLREHGLVVHTLDEGERLRRHLETLEGVSCVAVIGGGYIGMELSEALVRRGLSSLLIEREPQVMSTIDPEMAEPIHKALREFGVRLHLGESLEEVEAEGGRCRAVRTDAGRYEVDVVVVALGSRPNVDLAEAAGCRLGSSGALQVDGRMRTTVDGIWAAGDCVESRNLISGTGVNVQLGTHANKQGKIAGIDIATAFGAPAVDAVFPGVVGTAVTKVCRLEIARTGLSEREAAAAGIDAVSVTFTGTARAHYMPDPGEVLVRMSAERGTGRVLGAQMVGTGNVGKRIDVAATWCHLGVTVQDAQLFDLSYAPPFGGVWDLLQVAARKLVRELGLEPVL
jgi:NADPH-dependent 2,4-dienoyl-CoA reductase/sulfur reductase-like enzyme